MEIAWHGGLDSRIYSSQNVWCGSGPCAYSRAQWSEGECGSMDRCAQRLLLYREIYFVYFAVCTWTMANGLQLFTIHAVFLLQFVYTARSVCETMVFIPIVVVYVKISSQSMRCSMWLVIFIVSRCFFLHRLSIYDFQSITRQTHKHQQKKGFFRRNPCTVQQPMTSIQQRARTSRIILLATLVPSVIVATFDSLCSRSCPPIQFKFQSDHQHRNAWNFNVHALLLFVIESFRASSLSWPRLTKRFKTKFVGPSIRRIQLWYAPSTPQTHQRCNAFTDKKYNHRNSLDALGDSRPCAILHFVHSQCRISIEVYT